MKQLWRMWVTPFRHWYLTLERKCQHFDDIFITGCTGRCPNDNFQCSQWSKSLQNENIFVSVSHNKTNRTWSSYRWDILYTRHGSRLATWWRHQMETFSALLAICAGNSPVTDEFPSQRPVTRSFDVFFDLRLNKRMSKQRWGWRFETPSCSLWRHCNVYAAELWYTEHAGLWTKCQLFNPISLIYKEVPVVTQRRIARVFVHLLHSIGTHIATLFSCNGLICRLHDKHTIYPAWEREREREIYILSLSAFVGTEDIVVHVVHISRVITTYTLEWLSSLT